VIKKIALLKTCGANSEHKRSEVKRFSTLNKQVKRLRHCQLSMS